MQRKALASPSSAGSRAVARLGRTPFVVRATQEVMDAPSTSSSPSPASSSMASGGAVVQPYVNTPVSLKDAMAFGGPAPERINGRLAMIGFLGGFVAEIFTGKSIGEQFMHYPGPVLLSGMFIAYGSILPIVYGSNMSEAFGPLTPEVEKWNGRYAMAGLSALMLIESLKGSALF